MTKEEAKITLAKLKRYMSGGGVVDKSVNKAIDMAIEALSKPEPHWIPVTERPDKSGDYLATLIDGAEKWVEIIYWNETFGGSWQAVIGDEEYYSTIGNVIAWMPLPEPYKGVTE